MARRRAKRDDNDPPAAEERTPAADEFPAEDALAVPANNGLPDYPHCACGAALVMPDELEGGVCENCGHLGADGKLYQTSAESQATELAAAADDVIDAEVPAEPAPAASEPIQPSLLPPEPFDEHAAFEDLCKKARSVEAYRRAYEEKKQAAADAKKQLDSAALLLEQTTTTYDVKARAWAQEQERQAQLQQAYREQLEAQVAEQADQPVQEPAAQPEAAPALT